MASMGWRVFGVLLGMGILAPAYAQSPPHRSEDQTRQRVLSSELERWLSAVRSHSPGRVDRAEALIATWSLADLEKVVAEVKPLPFVDAPLLKRAAVLHADIAVLHSTSEGYLLPPDGSLDFIRDGGFVAKRAGTFHWRIGRRLLDLVEPDDDVLLWYTATSAFLQRRREYPELAQHLRRARRRFPEDGVLRLYEGTLHAAYAGPRVQNWLEAAFPRPDRDPRPIGSAREELKEAEGWLKSALGHDPGLVEARIRLACVRGQRGHHERAAADLRGVVERDLGPRMQYLAWLLLGREELALGRLEAARRALGRAAALYPEAQSPRLGLSLLSLLGGNRAASRGLLDLPAQASARGEDPWWTFDSRHEPDVDELLAQMRRRLAP